METTSRPVRTQRRDWGTTLGEEESRSRQEKARGLGGDGDGDRDRRSDDGPPRRASQQRMDTLESGRWRPPIRRAFFSLSSFPLAFGAFSFLFSVATETRKLGVGGVGADGYAIQVLTGPRGVALPPGEQSRSRIATLLECLAKDGAGELAGTDAELGSPRRRHAAAGRRAAPAGLLSAERTGQGRGPPF
jgi:hypothetical protein